MGVHIKNNICVVLSKYFLRKYKTIADQPVHSHRQSLFMINQLELLEIFFTLLTTASNHPTHHEGEHNMVLKKSIALKTLGTGIKSARLKRMNKVFNI